MYSPFVSLALDVKHVLDHARLRALHYRVFGLCVLCMVMDGFDVQSLGYVAPAIIQDWQIAPSLLGPVFAHGTNVSHADGKIVAIGPGKNFILETAAGQRLSFRCEAQCRGSLGHLQRHMHEKAHTDVYYIQGPNKSLMVLDVD